MKKILLLFLVCECLITGCANGESQGSDKKERVELTISAAASLQNVLEELGEEYTNQNPKVELRFNFGASGSLAQQIEQGAPVDLFISASEEKFDQLNENKLIDEGKPLVGNELVLITPIENPLNLTGFEDVINKKVEIIALGTPSTVPAGVYGKQVLQHFNLWEQVEKKVVYAKDVSQVLTYVETENVQAGIVYKTDALSSKKVKMIEIAPTASHDEIIYPIGLLKGTENHEEAKDFYLYLQNGEVKDIWGKYGFTLIQ